jgi:hypothetical protein
MCELDSAPGETGCATSQVGVTIDRASMPRTKVWRRPGEHDGARMSAFIDQGKGSDVLEVTYATYTNRSAEDAEKDMAYSDQPLSG